MYLGKHKWVAIPEFNSPAYLFHQAYQPVQMAPFFLLTQGFPLIHSHQEFQGHLACLKSLLVQQTPSHLVRNKNFYYVCLTYKEIEARRA